MIKSIERQELVRDYANLLKTGYASVFVGAGMSLDSGLPSWGKLMHPIAKAMGQEITKSTDFFELAEQYTQIHGQRTPLSNILLQQIRKGYKPTDNHRIIARLPFKKIWTSNFDNLIERTFAEIGKEINVISRDVDFTFSRYEQVKLYKIHGCIYNSPEKIVITRKDVEGYRTTYRQMAQAFENALSEQTFLFLGFSFEDVNFRTILGGIRNYFQDNQRQHYAILKKPKNGNNESEKIQFNYAVNDLAKYGKRVLQVDSYDEIPSILKDIEQAVIRSNIFISGSLKSIELKCDVIENEQFQDSIKHKNERISLYKNQFPYLDKEKKFGDTLSILGYNLSKKGYRLYSGFGEGVCDIVIEGAAQYYVRQDYYQRVFDALKIFPLPHRYSPLEQQNKYYREGMIGPCGSLIVANGYSTNADYLSGTMDEYQVAKGLSRLLFREQKAIINQLVESDIVNSKDQKLKEANVFSEDLKIRQVNVFSEKLEELMFLYNRMFFEQWKILIRLIDLGNEQIKKLVEGYGTYKCYDNVVQLITERQELFYQQFSVDNPFKADCSLDHKEISDQITNGKMIEWSASVVPRDKIRQKVERYIEAMGMQLEGDCKYYERGDLISKIELVLTSTFTKQKENSEAAAEAAAFLGSLKSPDVSDISKGIKEGHEVGSNELSEIDKRLREAFEIPKVIRKKIADILKKAQEKKTEKAMNYYSGFANAERLEVLTKISSVYIHEILKDLSLAEGFERIKSQRQIVKVKDFPNLDSERPQNNTSLDDTENGIYRVNPFWYSTKDIDKIIEMHEVYMQNFYKNIEKKKIYQELTKLILKDGSDIREMKKAGSKLFKINTTDQMLSYPYRSGTLIIPIACMNGMSFKIWKEERTRFIKRFAFYKNFSEIVEDNISISDCLIMAYDYLKYAKHDKPDFRRNLLTHVQFIIDAFTPDVSIQEILTMAKKILELKSDE